MYVYHCISPRFPVIEIKALSILKNFHHQSGIDVEEKILFRVESHVFVGEEFESKNFLPITKADLFLRIFEAYPGTLKRFETLYATFSAKTV